MTNLQKKPIKKVDMKMAASLILRHQMSQDNLITFCNQRKEFSLIAYTQTFSPSSLDSAPISKQLHYKMVDIFLPLATCCEFIILPEVHTSGGKKYGSIHFHGILLIKNKYKWFNKVLPFLKTLGHVLIKPIFELSKWITYLLKDYSTFIKILIEDYLITNLDFRKPYKIKEYIKNI